MSYKWSFPQLTCKTFGLAPIFQVSKPHETWEKEPITKGTPCSQWLFTIYLGTLIGSTVWVNSGHFKFSPGIAFAICTNQFHSSKKWHRRLETSIKDGFEENGTRISVWNIPSGKKEDYLLQEFHCSRRKLSTGTTQKVVFHLLSNRIFRNLLVNGKPPISPVIFRTYHEKKTIFETGPRSSVSYAKSYRA